MPSPQEIQRDYEYVAYIDEAGDPGLRRIQTQSTPGASEWFIPGCVLVRKSVEPEIPKIVGSWLSDLSVTQRQHLHYRDLSPTKRSAACRLVAENRNVLFVVCSHKKNMEGYRNDNAAAKLQEPDWFYNFMTRLLLERVTNFVLRDSLDKHGRPKSSA